MGSDSGIVSSSPSHRGLRDASFYPGYEVAGVVESIGEEVDPSNNIKVGDQVIVYPFDDCPPGYVREFYYFKSHGANILTSLVII